MQNNKDYFDQSLDEIKLLKYINESDPDDEHGMLRLFDYFYYKVGLHPYCEAHNSVSTLCAACPGKPVAAENPCMQVLSSGALLAEVPHLWCFAGACA